MEELLAVSDIRIEEKKHEQGFESKYVLGSSNAPANE